MRFLQQGRVGLRQENRNLRVVVRRVATGAKSFQWQVNEEGLPLAFHASEERFRSMQEAYEAGLAWLIDFEACKPPAMGRRRGLARIENLVEPVEAP